MNSSLRRKVDCYFLDSYSGHESSRDVIYQTNFAVAILNSIFAFPAIIGNIFVFTAISKTTSLHTPSYVLLACLSISDVIVGLVVQPTFVIQRIAEITGDFELHCSSGVMYEFFAWLVGAVSFATYTAISTERYLALSLHLRYRAIVTVRRVLAVVFVIWTAALALSGFRFWFLTDHILRYLNIPFLFLTYVISLIAYCKIFLVVRHHQQRVGLAIPSVFGDSASRRNDHVFDIRRYKSSTIAVMFVFGLFMISYFPYLSVMLAYVAAGQTAAVDAAHYCAATIIFLISSINPLLYYWRLKHIRRAVLRLTGRGHSSSVEPGILLTGTIPRKLILPRQK